MELPVGETLKLAPFPGITTLVGNCVQTKVPPLEEGVAVNVPELPEQIVIGLTEMVGFKDSLIVIDSTSVQPLEPVTVTE
jgi:hypothetical protein